MDRRDAGFKPGGTILINSEKRSEDFHFSDGFKVVTVNASTIAARNGLGSDDTADC